MATKVKDGLFIGDAEASQDPEFIELNKITFVVNCAGRQLPNLWEQHGLHYLTFPWTSDPDCTLFDGGNVVIEQISSFIDEAAEKGESVLVHSLEGTGRCIACVAAYLMFRHRWSFEKALDFLCNKRPDAAPNAGFVQQLYRLDLRLYEQWICKSKEPAEDDRIRHDQWIPLVPGLAPGLQKRTHGRSPAGGQRPESLAFSGASQGKYAISTVIADAAAGCFGGAASTFPSLGRLTEAQEEEIVLVHSFLNSQPQIDALPPGRVDYEDHVSKELHWIDRPRIDKLTAAGGLGRNKDRHQHMIPVSPRTGRAVPERPGNNSYNALSRGNKASTTVPGTTPPVVGILKTTSTPKREANVVDGRGDKIPHSLPALEPEACELGFTPSGDTTAAVSGEGGAGGAPLAFSSLPPSRRGMGLPKVDDEVFVEDLSEPQSDRWGGTEGCAQSEHETVSGGKLSSRSHAQGSALSPEDGADSSSSGEESERTAADSTPGGGSKSEQQGSSFKRGERDLHGPVAPARKEERQAWDGNSNNSGSSRGVDNAGASWGETGGSYGTGGIGDSGGEAKSNLLNTAKGSDKAGVTPPQAKLIPASYEGDRNIAIRSKLDIGGRAIDAAAQASAAAAAGRPVLPISKQLRRGGSEGSLKNSPTEISARTPTTPALAQDKARLPHASVGRAMKNDNMSSNDSPGPGWGPDDIRRKDVDLGGERRLGPESTPPAENGAYGKWQDELERETSGPTRLYPGADGEGGLQSLQQLAQTPNPPQRRLPSPRPQPELGQGDQRQGSSDAGSIFPQKRPSSAPPQRPNAPEDASSGGSGGGGSAAANPIPSSKAGAHRTRASSSVGAANQGYPAHGLMPSGSTVQMSANTDHGGRRGAVLSSEKGNGSSGSSTRPRYFSQAQEQSVGASGSNSSSQRIVVTSFGNGGGGGGGGGGGRPSPSTEQSPQARMSPDEAMNAEQHVANAHGSRRDRGNNAGALPRGIRTSQPTAPPSVDSALARVGSPAPPPTSERALGANSTGSDHSRARGSRRSSGAARNAVASRTKTSGILRPKAGTLPLPSRRGSSLGDSSGGVDGGGKNGESARWANPAPRGRHGYGNGSSGTNGYPRSTDSRGGGGGGSVSSRTADAYTYLSHGGSPQRSHDGGGQQRRTASAAPIYRSGSPAPVRGRKPSAANAASAMATDPLRLVYQQRTRVVDNKPQAFGIPPAFRGYMASSGGVADGGGRGATARRSQVSSPSAKDRVRRASTGSDRPVSSVPVPRASFAADSSEGQRPSTSEGLTGGSGAGRRGRSASPAPRPTSASGRRRSASPSPASLFTSKIDPSFDRPRWK